MQDFRPFAFRKITIGFPNHEPLIKVENSTTIQYMSVIWPDIPSQSATPYPLSIHNNVWLRRSYAGLLHSATLLFLLSNGKPSQCLFHPSRENNKSLGWCMLHFPNITSQKGPVISFALPSPLPPPSPSPIWAHDIGREGNGHHGRHIVNQGLGHVLQGW